MKYDAGYEYDCITKEIYEKNNRYTKGEIIFSVVFTLGLVSLCGWVFL